MGLHEFTRECMFVWQSRVGGQQWQQEFNPTINWWDTVTFWRDWNTAWSDISWCDTHLHQLQAPARWPTWWCGCLCRATRWAACREPRPPGSTPRCWLSCRQTDRQNPSCCCSGESFERWLRNTEKSVTSGSVLICFYKQSPHELRVSCGRFHGAERPHVFGSVAELVAGGQLTGQEAQGVKTEDPADKTYDNNDGD